MLKINKEGISQQTNLLAPAHELLAKIPPAGLKTAESAGVTEDEKKKPVASVGKAVGQTVSPKKLAANRKNAQKSTGPKTAAGKTMSSWNALKHGLVSKRLMTLDPQKAKELSDVLECLQRDVRPVGTAEEMLVEKIAHEYCRLANAAQFQNAESNLGYLSEGGSGNLVRYQTMINRQFFQAMNQLERLQRLRRGEDVPAPLNVQISHEISNEKRSGD